MRIRRFLPHVKNTPISHDLEKSLSNYRNESQAIFHDWSEKSVSSIKLNGQTNIEGECKWM